MKQQYHFPENLYSDIRIQESYSTNLGMYNGELTRDNATSNVGALVRVYDGK